MKTGKERNAVALTETMSKEALIRIETKKDENKFSIFTLADYVSTFPEHQQERYGMYQRVLELHQQEQPQTAIAKKLDYPRTTIQQWISETRLPPIEKHIRRLKDLDVYPLTPDNPHLPLLALMIGWIFGDGHLPRNLRYLSFFDGEEESLEKFKTYSKKYFPTITISDVKKHRENNNYYLTISNTAVAHLFCTLGVPAGNKVDTPFTVPEFILNGSKDVKRDFLAGILGSEMTTPKISHAHTAIPIEFCMSKNMLLEDGHRHFMEQIRRLLNEFGVTTTDMEVEQRTPPENPCYHFSIHGRAENLIKFSEKIPLFHTIKLKGMEKVMKSFNYHFERLECYNKTMTLKTKGMRPLEVYRELNGDSSLSIKTKQKVKVPYTTILQWINGKSKPRLAGNQERINITNI